MRRRRSAGRLTGRFEVRSIGPLVRGLALAAVLTTAGCGGGSGGGGPAGTAVGTHPGDVAPALSGTTLQGRSLSLAALRGSVAVVLFWASWCAPCQADQPAVDALAQEEAPRGVHFVGVSVDVDRGAAASYVTRYRVPYDSLVDTTQTIAVNFEVAGPPTTFVIDKNGRVGAELVGALDMATLRADIAAAAARG